MTSQHIVAAMLFAFAVYLLTAVAPTTRRLETASRRRELQSVSPLQSNPGAGPDGEGQVSSKQWAIPSCLLCAAVAWLLIGGLVGIVVAVGIAVIGPRVLARLEPAGTRANRLALEAAAPMVADLLAACLASGASTAVATKATAEALGGPVADVLNQCVTQFNLGASADRVWKPISDEPALAPIARAILRSAQTGAPLTSVLLRVADDLRLTRRTQLEQAAKTVGVKAVAPLGLCFLPAFMLLGVVPLIASLITAGISG